MQTEVGLPKTLLGNLKTLKCYPTCKRTCQPGTVLWMLTEDMRLLGQTQKAILLMAIAVAIESVWSCTVHELHSQNVRWRGLCDFMHNRCLWERDAFIMDSNMTIHCCGGSLSLYSQTVYSANIHEQRETRTKVVSSSACKTFMRPP